MAIAAWPNETEISELCKALNVPMPKIEFVNNGTLAWPIICSSGVCKVEKAVPRKFTEAELQFGMASAIGFGDKLMTPAITVMSVMIYVGARLTWFLWDLYHHRHELWAGPTIIGVILLLAVTAALVIVRTQSVLLRRADRAALAVTHDLPSAESYLNKVRLARLEDIPRPFRFIENRGWMRRIENIRKGS